MVRLSIALALLAGTASLAQAPATAQSQPDSPSAFHRGPTPSAVVLRELAGSVNCPVGFHANRKGPVQMFSASNGGKMSPTLGLHLTFDHKNSPAIDSIEITVYGVTPNVRAVPAAALTADTNKADTVSKSFSLRRNIGSDTLTDAEVWMHQVGALRWVDLNAVHYTDGAEWTSSEPAECRVFPTDLVLVGQR
ncbi:hypothetical protein [Granulicella sp. S190]|uniref:hypothetical protein n=1 Tax=Granulicella sp. S190 TaxID=1747226 RepID=UPI00131D50E2|nr:hypothetical protein [Granulicella sp. S190]